MSRPLPLTESASEDEGNGGLATQAPHSSYRIERLGPASRADLMITSRAKRSTAGNKLKALLDQELEKDDIFAEVENDVDFHADEMEGIDIVDSDFDRDSDDNAAPGAEDDESEGERELEAREKAEKQKRRAQSRQVGVIKRPLPPPPPARKSTELGGQRTHHDSRDAKRRHISFAQDQIGSTASSSTLPSALDSRRTSARSSTVQSKMQIESRLSEAIQRRASLPVKAAPRKRTTLTQDALIAEALEVEEENRESLRRFLEMEEERRAKMRQRKDRIVGPFVRWHSIGLKTRVVEEVADDAVRNNSPVSIAQGGHGHQKATSPSDYPSAINKPDPVQAESRPIATQKQQSEPVICLSDAVQTDDKVRDKPRELSPPTSASSDQHTLPHRPSLPVDIHSPSSAQPASTPVITSAPLTLDPVLEARKEAALLRVKTVGTPALSKSSSSSTSKMSKYETQARTLLSVERMPDDWEWLDEFNSLLGTHCDWESYPFVPARNRPPRPRQSVCPITGLPAIYKCPRSGIPYANAHAFSVITRLLEHRFIWTGGHSQTQMPSGSGRKGKRIERPGGVEVGAGTIGAGAAPPEMGVYVDSDLESGPAGVWTTARATQPTSTHRQSRVRLDSTNRPSQNQIPVSTGRKTANALNKKPRNVSHPSPTLARDEPATPLAKKPHFEVVLTNALAPGDEASVMAAALNLPAGSTRSGRRVQRPL